MTHTSTQRRVAALALFVTLLCGPLQAEEAPSPPTHESVCQQFQGNDLEVCRSTCTAWPISRDCMLVVRFGHRGMGAFNAVKAGDNPESAAKKLGMKPAEAHRFLLFLEGFGLYKHQWVVEKARDAKTEALHQEGLKKLTEGQSLIQIKAFTQAIAAINQSIATLEKTVGNDHPMMAGTFFWRGWAQEKEGDQKAAVASYQRAETIYRKVCGPSHPNVAGQLFRRAIVLHAMDNNDAALDAMARTIAIYDRIFGTVNLSTASTRQQLAAWSNAAGDAATTRQHLEAVLSLHERTYGPWHATTSQSVSNLAQVLEHMGDFEAALGMHQRALSIDQRISKNNPKTLAFDEEAVARVLDKLGRKDEAAAHRAQVTRHLAAAEEQEKMGLANRLYNDAQSLKSKGHYRDAIAPFQRSLALHNKLLGPKHLDVAQVSQELGEVLFYSGRYPEAEAAYERALTIRTELLAPGDLKIAALHNNLGVLYEHQGQLKRAEKAHLQALAMKEKALGPDNVVVATSLHNLAMVYNNLSDYSKAIPYFLRAAESYERAEDPDLASALDGLAGAYDDLGRFREVEPLYLRALAIREKVLGKNHPDVAVSLNNLGQFYQTMGDYKRAETHLKRSIAINQKAYGGKHPRVATTTIKLGMLYGDYGDLTRAEKTVRQGLELRREILGPEHPDMALALNNLSVVLSSKGEYKKAEALIRQAHAISEKVYGTKHKNAIATLINLGTLYEEQAKLDQAMSILKGALATVKKHHGTDHPLHLVVQHKIARVLQTQAKYADALVQFNQVLSVQLQQVGPEHPDVANSLASIAVSHYFLGEYADAERRYKESMAIHEKAYGKKHRLVARTLGNLGALYLETGDFHQAEVVLHRALKMYGDTLGFTHIDTAAVLDNLGELARSKGDPKKARTYIERALAIEIATFGEEHHDVATSLQNLGLCYIDSSEFEQAKKMLQRAQTIKRKILGDEHPSLATSIDAMAYIDIVQGRFAQALAPAKRALAIREKAMGKDHPDVAVSHNQVGFVALAQGRVKDALRDFKRAETIYSKRYISSHPFLLAALSNQVVVYERTGDFTTAEQVMNRLLNGLETHIRLVLQGGSEAQRRRFLATASDYVHVALGLATRTGRQESFRLGIKAVHLFKGRVLDAMAIDQRAIRGKLKDADRSLFDELQRVRTQLAQLTYAPTKDEKSSHIDKLQTLSQRAEQLESRISVSNASYRKNNQSFDLRTLRKQVPEGGAYVEYYAYRTFNQKTLKPEAIHYAAYILRRDGKIGWVDLGARQPIDQAVARFRKSMVAGDMSVLEHGRALHALIMEPLTPHIKAVNSLIVSPDGALNLVPYAALMDTNWEPLLQKYVIRYLTGARDLLADRASPSRQPPLVVAAPAYSNEPIALAQATAVMRSMDMKAMKVKPLPGTRKEAEALQKHLKLSKNRILLDKHASETALKEVHGPKILHVATHGFFLPAQTASPGQRGPMGTTAVTGLENPLLRTGLALAGFNQRDKAQGTDDGVLTGLELASLDLYGTELVVLSACETGLGEVDTGEGVYGLKRALVLAGSRTQVVSLWKVSDAETRALMSAYYQRLAKGEDRAEAMRQVQLSMYRDQQKHPVHWAAFVVSGADGPVSIPAADTTTAPRKP